MKITIWGCRGSIASPGQNMVRYGGNCSCLEIRPREGGVIIVDAGSGIRLLGKKLAQDESLKELYMILTHAHWDHLSGFPYDPDRTDDELDRQVAYCRKLLRKAGASVTCFAAAEGMEINL